MDHTTLSWNVRGLNNSARRKVVADLVTDHKCNIVCLQETKLEVITSSIVAETLGNSFSDNFVFLPAIGSRGGILLAANADHYSVSPQPNLIGTYSISVLITDLNDNSSWMMTGVYGPQEASDKLLFIAEMCNLKNLCPPEWVILGDFNLISRASEKSNPNINLRLLCAFRAVIDDLGLKELPLLGAGLLGQTSEPTPHSLRSTRCFSRKNGKPSSQTCSCSRVRPAYLTIAL